MAAKERLQTDSRQHYWIPEIRKGSAILAGLPLPPSGYVIPAGSIVIKGYGDSSSGYGKFTGELAKQIEKQGIPVAFRPIHIDEERRPLDPWLRDRVIASDPIGPVLQMATPHSGVVPGSIIFTMWESTRIAPEFVAAINTARACVVPCHANTQWFADSGVTVPIRVVPLGIDPVIYHPTIPEPRHGFCVLGAARVSHGGERKGIDDLLGVFLEALGSRSDAFLRVKLWPDCKVDDPGHPRIMLDRGSYSEIELADLYRSCSAYMTLSRGEGWGMSTLEAMACGRPVIAPPHSGMADYLTPESCYPVEFDAEPGGGVYYTGQGNWFRYRRESAIAQLRDAYADAAKRRAKGEAASRRAAEFPWSRGAAALLTVCREFGLFDNVRSVGRSAIAPAVRDAILACPARGPENSIKLESADQTGCGCGGVPELTPCKVGKGARPGQVRLSECVECRSVALAAAPEFPQAAQ